MTTKIKIQLGAIFILTVLALSLLLSQNAAPDFPPFWSLKRIQEKVFLNFKTNPEQRTQYLSFLLDNRLDELSKVVKNKHYDHVLKASLRYSTTAGLITDLVISNNLTSYVEPIRQKFLNHQKVLNDLYVLYPKNTDNLEYKYIEDDINYLNIYLDKLLNFFKVEKA